jgi:glycosyltransferase involved in cell wall biosynthesis
MTIDASTQKKMNESSINSSSHLSIIIPVFNEAESICEVILELKTCYPDAQILVVDDGSTDNTAQMAVTAGAQVYRHPYNMGNGAAVKSGIRLAQGEIVVFMDGDGQHQPRDVAELISYFPDYDMVVGARLSGSQASVGRAFGNKVYNWLASYVSNFYIEDLTSGFRAIKVDLARSFLYLLPNTYSYPTTLTLGILRSGLSVKYIPINAHPRKSGKSNIKLFSDGIRFFMIITKICTLYSPLRVFLPVSCSMFVAGLLNYLYTFIVSGRFTNMSALMFTTSITIFMMGLVSEQISQMRFERRATLRMSTIKQISASNPAVAVGSNSTTFHETDCKRRAI